jgi:NAD(P)-dependent dehydrogenase (short-subunit alcohol dehydrogenase family)
MTYLIIGAAGGIGTALTQRLAARGATLALVGRTAEPLAALAASTPGARTYTADARDLAQLEAAVTQATTDLGPLTGIVNLAGSIVLKPAHITSADEFADVIAQNLTTAFNTVRTGARAMPNGGAIVLMSSAAGRTGLPNHEAIAAAKAGVIGLARSAAATYAPKGLRVNVVAPGLVRTPLAARITSNPAAERASLAMHPLGKLGEADDVARVIEWLITDDSSWVTGEVIGVDGGLASVRSQR